MRKIHILKAIVDFLWIVTIPILIIIPVFIFILFYYQGNSEDFLTIFNVKISRSSLFGQLLITVSLLSYVLLLYSLYLFRKTLRYFLQLKIFDDYIIKTFQKIGVLLSIWGVLTLIISFISKIYFKQKIIFNIGINEHIIILCLGLFFMILSEVFKIAKTAKQENDLTI